MLEASNADTVRWTTQKPTEQALCMPGLCKSRSTNNNQRFMKIQYTLSLIHRLFIKHDLYQSWNIVAFLCWWWSLLTYGNEHEYFIYFIVHSEPGQALKLCKPSNVILNFDLIFVLNYHPNHLKYDTNHFITN